MSSFASVLVRSLLAAAALGLPTAAAQLSADSLRDAHWTRIYEERGVVFSFIFYREGDNEHNGVVVRLDNLTDRPARVRFTMVFRSDTSEYVAEPYERLLEPGEMVTGSDQDLWWIPFRDERQVREVGMRAIEVALIDDAAPG